MLTARIAIILGFLLGPGSAIAAIHPGAHPILETQRKPAPQTEKVFRLIVEQKLNELPLECRGYNVRPKSIGARLARCE